MTTIEGNTLDIYETRVILEDGITIGGKSVREHLEVLNIRDALEWLMRSGYPPAMYSSASRQEYMEVRSSCLFPNKP